MNVLTILPVKHYGNKYYLGGSLHMSLKSSRISTSTATSTGFGDFSASTTSVAIRVGFKGETGGDDAVRIAKK